MCHIWKECADFAEALKNNVVYMWNNRVHVSEWWRLLEMNTGCGGMKRLMEEAKARHVEAVHYSASTRIRVGREKGTRRRRILNFG